MGPEFVGVRLDTYAFHIRYKWFVFSSQTCQTLWLVLTKEQKRTVITRETHTLMEAVLCMCIELSLSLKKGLHRM